MAVMKATEVNDILNLTASTSRNDDFTRLIKYVQDDICEYLNNWFEDPIIWREGGSAIEFVRGNTDTATTQADYITDTEAKLSSVGFSTGYEYDIMVRGGGRANAGIHHVVSLSTAGGTFTLDSTGTLGDVDLSDMQNYAGGCKISLVGWPNALKPYVAQMVWHRYNRPKPSGVISESIDDYSVTYAGSNAYPTETVDGLAKWRRAVMV